MGAVMFNRKALTAIMAVAVALVALVAVFAADVSADDTDYEGYLDVDYDSLEWTEISGTYDGGDVSVNIRLAGDVTLSDYLNFTGGGVYYLDLAGYELTGSGSTYVVYVDESTLVLVDSSEDSAGTITGGYATTGGGIYVYFGVLVMGGGTITGNTSTSSSYGGGGVYLNTSSFYMYGGAISNNTASAHGGGIHGRGSAYGSTNFYMYGGTITGNSSIYGGAVSLSLYVHFYMYGGTISDNTASSYGGGIYIGSSSSVGNTLYLYGGTISNNSSIYGGGVSVNGASAYNVTTIIDGTTISGNTASSYGGGMYSYFNVTMESGTISNNSSDYGGGVYNYSGSFTMNGGTISNNTASSYGGGLYLYSSSSDFQMYGGEFYENSAAYGGAICVYSLGSFDLYGGEFYDNTATSEGNTIVIYPNPATSSSKTVTITVDVVLGEGDLLVAVIYSTVAYYDPFICFDVTGGEYGLEGAYGNSITITANRSTVSVLTSTLDIPESEPARSGYVFYGWSESDLSQTSVAPSVYVYGDSVNFTEFEGNVLYAVWCPSFTLYYVSQGEVFASESEGYESYVGSGDSTASAIEFAIISSEPTRSGYTFYGWSESDLSQTSVAPSVYVYGDTIMLTGDTYLYAVWYGGYTLSYVSQGEVFASESSRFYIGSGDATNTDSLVFSIISSEPTRSGYTFYGWSESDLSQTSIAPSVYVYGDTVTLTGDTYLYAVWYAAWALTYVSQGEVFDTSYVYFYTGSRDASYSDSEDVSVISSEPVRTGYAFYGWSESDLSQTVDAPSVYVYGDAVAISGDTVLYSVWLASWTLSYDGNGNSLVTGVPDAQTVGFYIGSGDAASVSVVLSSESPSWIYYEFLGWALDSASDAVEYSPGGTIAISGDTVLYAVWNLTLTITIEAEDGQTMAIGDSLSFTASASSDEVTIIWGLSSDSAKLATLIYDEEGNATVYAVAVGTLTLTAMVAENTAVSDSVEITIAVATSEYVGGSDGDPLNASGMIDTIAGLLFDDDSGIAGLAILVVVLILMMVVLSPDVSLILVIPLSMLFYALGFVTSSILILMIVVAVIGLTVTHRKTISSVLRKARKG